MKFKRYIYILGLFIALVGFNACQEDALVEPSPSPTVPEGCIGVFFPNTNKVNFEFEPTDETVFELSVAREVSTGSAEVPIVVEVNTDDVFKVPATASFAAGEEKTTITITFPTAEVGKKYSLGLKVEGEEYVNPYSKENPTLSTAATRIKWEPIEKKMVYIDGTFKTIFNVPIGVPMYVSAEKATLASSVKYRFKNAYNSMSTGVDENGIHDGFPHNEPGDFDADNVYYTVIEVVAEENKPTEVSMEPFNSGIDWGYGMISMGSIYGNISTNKDSYPLGELENNKIVFPGNSLYFSMANYNSGGKYPAGAETIIYLTVEDFIADNMKITDFNDVEYEVVEGEVGTFESKAFDFFSDKVLSKAIDIDDKNENSEYKGLHYISDLYADNFGLAFYFDGEENLSVVNNQPTGTEFVGKKVYVSSSKDVLTTVSKNSKGVTIFTFGLNFHFADGTSLGDFAETYYYSEDAVVYEKKDFIGSFVMTGGSQFGPGNPDAKMNVKLSEGVNTNELIVTGVKWAEKIIAVFNPNNSTISIEPQELADINRPNGDIWDDITLYTTDLEGSISADASMVFTYDMKGNIILSDDTEADGYLIRSVIAGGWLDGYHSLQFAPAPESKSTRSASSDDVSIKSFESVVAREIVKAGNNLKIQGKVSHKKIINTNNVAF